MTPERLHYIQTSTHDLNGFVPELLAEIDHLTRELANVIIQRDLNHEQWKIIEADRINVCEANKRVGDRLHLLEAENARLREALERITQIVPEEQTSPLTALTFAFKLAEVVLQAAKEKP